MQTKDGLKFSYALSLATQLGFTAVASIGGFLALGMWLDAKLHTSPFLLLAGVALGVVVTIYEVHHLIKPLITPDKKEDVC
jgi:F0F1-type ATP synthase assembly protein I